MNVDITRARLRATQCRLLAHETSGTDAITWEDTGHQIDELTDAIEELAGLHLGLTAPTDRSSASNPSSTSSPNRADADEHLPDQETP